MVWLPSARLQARDFLTSGASNLSAVLSLLWHRHGVRVVESRWFPPKKAGSDDRDLYDGRYGALAYEDDDFKRDY